MGAMQPPKQFYGPGVILNPDEQRRVVMPAQALPPMPTTNLPQGPMTPMYAAPNATPAPKLPGVNNNPDRRRVLAYGAPGGYGGGFRGSLNS